MNLLPWREEARSKRRQSFKWRLGIMSVIVCSMLFYMHCRTNYYISERYDRNKKIKESLDILEKEMRLEKERIRFKKKLAKQKHQVENFQFQLSQFTDFFETMLPNLPSDMYFIKMSANSKEIWLKGYAGAPISLAAFMKNISRNRIVKFVSSEKVASSLNLHIDTQKNYGFKLHLILNAEYALRHAKDFLTDEIK